MPTYLDLSRPLFFCLGGDGASSSLDDDEDEDEGEGGSSLRFLEEEDFLDPCLFFERLSSTEEHTDRTRQEVGGNLRAMRLAMTKRKGRGIFPTNKWEHWTASVKIYSHLPRILMYGTGCDGSPQRLVRHVATIAFSREYLLRRPVETTYIRVCGLHIPRALPMAVTC